MDGQCRCPPVVDLEANTYRWCTARRKSVLFHSIENARKPVTALYGQLPSGIDYDLQRVVRTIAKNITAQIYLLFIVCDFVACRFRIGVAQ